MSYPAESLRALIRERAAAATIAAAKSGGAIAAEELRAIEDLARLLRIHDSMKPPPRRSRWPVAVMLGVTLLLSTLLLFVPRGRTRVELDLRLSEVSFALPVEQILIDGMSVDALGVGGLRRVELPEDGPSTETRSYAARAGDMTMRLSVGGSDRERGSIDIGAVVAPAGTRIVVGHGDTPREYHLSLSTPKGARLALRADVHGTVLFDVPGALRDTRHFGVPRPVVFEPSEEEVDFILSLPAGGTPPITTAVLAKDLVLARVDQILDPEMTILRGVSTIIAGTVHLEELDGRRLELRPGEALRFTSSEGYIPALALGNDGISLAFSGDVDGMSTGPSDRRRSLMPSWLEWLAAQHGLSLLWGTTLYVFGLVLGVLRWWRVPAT